MIPVVKILFLCPPLYKFKNPHTHRFCMVTPIVSSKYRRLYQFCYVKLFSTNRYKNLLLLDDPGRVRSQIASIVRQIQRFDFDRNLAVTRKLIIWTRAPLRTKPLYSIEDPRIQFVYTSSVQQWHPSYKSTDCGVPPAEIDHGLNLADHNCGHLVQWKCDVPTAGGTIDRRSTAVYTYCIYVQLCTDRYTIVHSTLPHST
jgi:hypothetical protein